VIDWRVHRMANREGVIKMPSSPFRFLLSGHDTIEVCYYLRPESGCLVDFQEIAIQKEALRQSKRKEQRVITLASESFLLKPYGSQNKYPFVMENSSYTVEFGEFNYPSFRVKFRSRALWELGALALHKRFMAWAESIGLSAIEPESLSRADFTFDYLLLKVDFDEDNLISLSRKDHKYRDGGRINGLVYGKSDIVLRVYDKVKEIAEQSGKGWFFQLWGDIDENVWRIEWQTRQQPLRRFGIRTLDDLFTQQGDLLRYLVTEHDTLRIKTDDSNRSRWPLHPLWMDLAKRISDMECQGVYRVIDDKEALNERLMRIAISIYGNLKRIGAIHSVRQGQDFTGFNEAFLQLEHMLRIIHDPMTWKADVDSRVKEIQFGQW
jgi:hypothetical protein